MRRALSLLAVITLTTGVIADERYLLPIVYPNPVSGAHGSVWASTFVVHNRGDEQVAVGLFEGCNVTCVYLVPPHAVVEGVPPSTIFAPRNGPGAIFWVSGKALLSLSLRIRDISREHLTWGTEMPVVAESAALTTDAQFLNVPTDDRFRQMLRIYSFDVHSGADVEVSFYAASGAHLASRTVHLQPPAQQWLGLLPGYAEIASLSLEFPIINSFENVRIQVKPLTPGLRYWAFVSVTHNETQHVTIITPATH